MKRITITAICVMASLLFAEAKERILLLNEGIWQADNGKLTYFEDGAIVSNEWFRDSNGMKLGDTPNDIIAVNDDLIAISVNWSNIIQFIDASGRAVAATEDIPNNRKLASDGRYVYATSYGHECGTEKGTLKFTKGYVAKIDATTFRVTDAVEVGYEPEGIALYEGYLFVANSGGYAFQEDHDYETTVTVLDAATLQTVRVIDTGQINLYGKMSQSDRWLCINSPGDYYNAGAATVILDCRAAIDGKPDDECFVKLDCAATFNCTAANGDFYAVGARYSYISGDYSFNYVSISPAEVMETAGAEGVREDDLPGDVAEGLKGMAMPYGIYVNPYTGYIYATDAGSFTAAGSLYQWTPEGELLGKHRVYINPAHFLALRPDDTPGSVDSAISDDGSDAPIFDLMGRRILSPAPGQIYIRNGKKYVEAIKQ